MNIQKCVSNENNVYFAKKVYFSRAQAKTRLPPASVSKIADSISLPPSHSKDFIVWL